MSEIIASVDEGTRVGSALLGDTFIRQADRSWQVVQTAMSFLISSFASSRIIETSELLVNISILLVNGLGVDVDCDLIGDGG